MIFSEYVLDFLNESEGDVLKTRFLEIWKRVVNAPKYTDKLGDLIGFKNASKTQLFCNKFQTEPIEKMFGLKFVPKDNSHYFITLPTTDGSRLTITTTGSVVKGHDANGKPSKGHAFENKFAEDINAVIQGKKAMPAWLEKFTKEANITKLIRAEKVGSENNKRPIYSIDLTRSIKQTMNTPEIINIGRKISDVIVYAERGGKYVELYCSLKMGKTTNFANQGISAWFPEHQMMQGKLPAQGEALISAFGLDTKKFCDVFNKYDKIGGGKTQAPESRIEHPKVDKNALGNYIAQAIGSGYYYIKLDGDMEIKYVDENLLGKIVNSIKSVECRYPINIPGSNKQAKRVESTIFFKNGASLKVVFREKSGKKKYPDFIMPEPKNWSWDF